MRYKRRAKEKQPGYGFGTYFASVLISLLFPYLLNKFAVNPPTVEVTRFLIGASFIPGINSAISLLCIIVGSILFLSKSMYFIGSLLV